MALAVRQGDRPSHGTVDGGTVIGDKRTYAGPRYLGGYSDHLPIYIDLRFHAHIRED